MNIPIYRAKSNERKNSYVEGLLIGVDEELNLCTIRTKDDYIGGEICYIHTLSINFPDMLDSQGNKIFASLSKDGKGGDIVEFEHIRYLEDDEPSYMIKGLCKFIDSSFLVEDIDNKFDRVFYDEMGCNFRNKELRVIGIQE